MRRCGHNPTDIEVADIINKIHDDSGTLDLEVTPNFIFSRFSPNASLGFLQDHG